MREVEERVSQMLPQQQKQLLKTLYELEKTARPSSTAVMARKPNLSREQVIKARKRFRVFKSKFLSWFIPSLEIRKMLGTYSQFRTSRISYSVILILVILIALEFSG